MLTKKIIQVGVDLLDVNHIYNPNKEEFLMNALKTKYVNKCYQSILIKKISLIIKHSLTYINTASINGVCYINVLFEVEGIIISPGTICHGCVVESTNNTGIIIDNPNISGMLLANSTFSIYQTNQQTKNYINSIMRSLSRSLIIPVIVLEAKYETGQNKITINGIPFIPIAIGTIIYEVKQESDTNTVDAKKMETLLEQLLEEYKLHLKLIKTNNKGRNFFKENVMNPFKKKFENSDLFSNCNKILNIEENDIENNSNLLEKIIKSIKIDQYITFPQESIDEEYLNIYSVKNKIDPEKYNNIQIVSGTKDTILLDIFTTKLNYLQALRGFIENYNNTDIKKYTAYFAICKLINEPMNCNYKLTN
jgi:hypothetical protein